MHVDCGRLIDGTGEVIEDARLRVEDGVVAAVGSREGIEAAGERIDHAGETVVPGLIDAYCHLVGARSMDPMDWVLDDDALGAARATADLRALLRAGFTTVRDCGSSVALGLREAVADGTIPGPRIYTSGRAISQTAGHGDTHQLPYDWAVDAPGVSTLADGPDECRKEARKRIREGVDLLKIMTTGGVLSEKDAPDQSQFTDSEVAAMTEEAHRVGIPVASHAQGAAGIERALENGVDTIEHGIYLDECCIDLFHETGATLVPTLSIMERITAEGADHGVPEYGLRKAREARAAHFDAVERAHEAGVPIATGTDFLGPELAPYGENALELELLCEHAGMSEHEAIRSATGVAARTLPDDDVGTLTPGDRADFVALGADPLAGVSNVRAVVATYVGGDRVEA